VRVFVSVLAVIQQHPCTMPNVVGMLGTAAVIMVDCLNLCGLGGFTVCRWRHLLLYVYIRVDSTGVLTGCVLCAPPDLGGFNQRL